MAQLIKQILVQLTTLKNKDNIIAEFLSRDASKASMAAKITENHFQSVRQILLNNTGFTQDKNSRQILRNYKIINNNLFRVKGKALLKVIETTDKLLNIFKILHDNLEHIGEISTIFQQWALDFIGLFSLSKSGRQYVLVGVGFLSGFPIAKAVATTILVVNINFIKELVGISGALNNEQVERLNRKLRQAITMCSHPNFKNYDFCLQFVLLGLRLKISLTTGSLPSELMFEKNLRLWKDRNEKGILSSSSKTPKWVKAKKRDESFELFKFAVSRTLPPVKAAVLNSLGGEESKEEIHPLNNSTLQSVEHHYQ
ncbi:hypothetical protein BB561_004412 [Smittium simulii]|uniref:Uncharacterized protein n=1 Tax=Smittium simulii TaxID=133385 RepID=A0A2T9YGA7_9FUNG|nr:hypothetical protein BB561_004412 [Smittium simulii]